MTILKDGEKYACKQCVQGHRVSGCNHYDRPLQHVNKKGRPVSQCPHCRGLRKARSTHIKCECGERRHSRNASSESASVNGDKTCNCAQGKKCTCALKKDPADFDASSMGAPSPSSSSYHSSPAQSFAHARRSESAVPRIRHSHHMSMGRSNFASQELGVPYTIPRVYPFGKHHRAAQRSVDSLPLSMHATPATYPPPPLSASPYDTQFLNPDYALQQSNHASPSTVYDEPSSNDFAVQLDQAFIDKTQSPQNPKRYSMNDFSMLNLTGVGELQEFHDQHSFSAGGFPMDEYTNESHFYNAAVQNPPPQSVASTDFAFPALTRSSSGTTSEQGDIFPSDQSSSNAAVRPMITVDPSWHFPAATAAEKSAFSFTPSSYQGTPHDYRFAGDDAPTPNYDIDSAGAGFNPFSTEPRSGSTAHFPFTMADFTHSNVAHDAGMHVLPDRSTQFFTSDAEPALNMEFRFPGNEIGPHDTFPGHEHHQPWPQMTPTTTH